MVLTIHSVEVSSQRLSDAAIDIQVKVAIVEELRESIEIVQSAEYPRYLAALLPVFQSLLSEHPPVFGSDAPEQKLRNLLLEIIHRFPQNEHLKPFANELMTTLMTLLRTDNEDNAVLCLKIITDLHKNYKNSMESFVQPFLDTVKEMFSNMDQAIEDVFDEENQQVIQSASVGDGETQAHRMIPKSMYSFKVLTDCPIIIALLFQLYRKFVNPNVTDLVPFVIHALDLQPIQQREAHEEAEANDTLFIGVSPGIKNRVAYAELKALQVKTVSFLAYILKSYVQLFRPHAQAIARAVVGLMKDCPPEASATRKELLVATRHIWQTEFRLSFVSHIQVLLNENLLTGSGVTCKETLRPLAHSVLVDLIHHIRNDLNWEQLSKIIFIYSKHLQDPSFAPNIHTMCVKLLLNLVDCVVKLSESQDGRPLLIHILEAFSCKLTALRIAFPVYCKYHHKRRGAGEAEQNTVEGGPLGSNSNLNRLETERGEDLTMLPEYDGYLDLGFNQPIRTSTRPLDSSADLIKDLRFLLKYLIPGIKTVVSLLSKLNPPNPANVDAETWQSVARGFSEEQLEIFSRIAKDGMHCFSYFVIEHFDANGLVEKKSEAASPTSKDEKEVLEAFASIFVSVEPSVFQELFSCQIPFLLEQAVINPQLFAIPQYFLATANLSPGFAGLLLKYLVTHLDQLGGPDLEMASVMLKLFKLVFMAIKTFPDKNESVLRIYISTIITSSMKMSGNAIEPTNYFAILRALFRAISGGRFEALYQEVLPLLPVLLEGLNHMLATAQKQSMKELFVELCLTVPVRLSVLLPYLSFLMKPLVIALQSGPELVSQGLRTLELCIDNLTHDFLEPILSPVINELMVALWKHLKPEPYNPLVSQTTLRILGKLGGQNRKLLKDPPTLAHREQMETGIELAIVLKPYTDSPKMLSLDAPLASVVNILKEGKLAPFFMSRAFEFLKGCIPLLFDIDAGPDYYHLVLQQHVRKYISNRHLRGSDISSPMEVDAPDARTIPSETNPKMNPFPSFPSTPHSKLLAHSASTRDLLMGMFYATLVPQLADESSLLIEHLCRHFALLSVSSMASSDQTALLPYFHPAVKTSMGLDGILSAPCSRLDSFVDAIVQSMSCENSQLHKQAEDALMTFYNTSLMLLVSKEAVEDMTIFKAFASKFSSCCYHPEWFKKSGGCRGIALLTTQLSLGTDWMLEHELEFVKSLLYVLKDTSTEISMVNVAIATSTLSHVLHVCNSPSSETVSGDQEPNAKFNSLIALLISELSNSNSTVRETIQSSFQALADLTGTDVTSLLTPVRDRLLTPIFAKPLRALPIAMQIGHIDAITYCLSLRPTMLTFSDELLRLLHEALALADAEDQALIIGKASQYRNATALTNLRVVCIELLSSAMACSEFNNAKLSGTRGRIISVFFKSLYSKSGQVVQVANKGLQQVLSTQHKLPKDLLQAGLRPILVNLSDHKRLTVSGLEGLARLLELLTNYFKVEIGRKLLDHLKQWAEPQMLEDAAGKPLSEVEDIKIIVGILNVFHLLPAAANIFLEELVNQVLELEQKLRRYRSSPFRDALIKFLNRYSSEAVDHFYGKISSPSHNRLFVGILGSMEAEALRSEIVNSPAAKFIAATFGAEESDRKLELQIHGSQMLKEICQYHPDFLLSNREILDHLKRIWQAEFIQEETYNVAWSRKKTLLQNVLDLFILYCENTPSDANMLLEMVNAFDPELGLEQDGLKMYIFDRICGQYSPELKRGIILCFLDIFRDNEVPDSRKALIIRMLITPLLAISHSQGVFLQVVDSKIVETIETCIWKPRSLESSSVVTDPVLVVELLQLTALLIQCNPQIIHEAKKNVIKFAWSYIKVDDVICKQAAYVVLARFFYELPSPSKLIIQVFVALLRSHQSEVRVLVRQALDILLPKLPERIPASAGAGAGQTSIWVRWTRRVIIEDGHTSSQLFTIYQLITRHPSLFYDSRDSFIPQITNSLSRLGLAPASTKETKALTMDLVELILSWEQQEMAVLEGFTPQPPDTPLVSEVGSHADKKIKIGSSGAIATAGNSNSSNRTGPQLSNFREMLVSYLIRLVTSLNETMEKKELVYRSLNALNAFLVLWSDVGVRLALFERIAAMEITENNHLMILNSLELLKIILDAKDDQWLLMNLSQLSKILEPWVRCDNIKIVKALDPILDRIFSISNSETLPEMLAFIKLVDGIVKNNLQDMTNPLGTAMLLCVSYGNRTADMTAILADVMKLLQKLTRDHLASSDVTLSVDAGILLSSMLKLLKSRTSLMGDQRKWFLLSIVQLIEKSSNTDLLRLILSVVSEWIRGKGEAFPTSKEKANLMVKMLEFRHSTDSGLFEEYLGLVADIYSDKSFLRSELAVRLEQAFMLGTKANNPVIRIKFAEILSQSIDRNVNIRLNYIFGVQNWESIATSFWLRQALELLFNSAVMDTPLHPSQCSYRLESLASFFAAECDPEILTEKNTESLIKAHQTFLLECQVLDMKCILNCLCHLIYVDQELAFDLWCEIFPLCWESMSPGDRHAIVKCMIPMLAKDYHLKQAHQRPNVVQALLEGIRRCVPPIHLPPQLVKYLSKSFNSWYSGLELLEAAAADNRPNSSKDEDKIRESTLDALSELYDCLGEEDYFFGLWRRRCLFAETNSALSFEQNGFWASSQLLYEQAQQKARTGIIPFTESEYNVWEDHWVLCGQRLQQWDILTDLAKHESNYDLMIECAWRSADWVAEKENILLTLSGVSENNPRKRIFEIFSLWHRLQTEPDKLPEFQKLLEGGMQQSLKLWTHLPETVTQCHIPLLHQFQLFVELQEAAQIQSNLASTNAGNVDVKNNELKAILQVWRDRLPNLWDDVNLWSDLVAWRQHVFGVVNKAYMPLLPVLTAAGAGSQVPASSYAYRGYHETAWIINRFAHVARKHKLTDVCVNQLTKIYTLPNIEIHEAFYKLREQAKCYAMTPTEWPSGLDVVNNTNLMYFSPSQKAEFWTLKAVFFANLNLHEEAKQAFSSATQIDLNLARAWASWGQYNDRMFKETPVKEDNEHLKYAGFAVNCYMHAASLHNSSKSRKYLARVLWLLSLDDDTNTISAAYDNFKGEHPLWYWITFIPQLLSALSSREGKMTRPILMKLAKSFPQALHFQLRTVKEDLAVVKKQALAAAAQSAPEKSDGQEKQPNPETTNEDEEMKDVDSSLDQVKPKVQENDREQVKTENDDQTDAMKTDETKPTQDQVGDAKSSPAASVQRQPWEYVDEVMALLKTAFPLLALSMETMVDQIINKLKPTTDEDIYRLIVALLNDGVMQLTRDPIDSSGLSPATETNLSRFAESMYPNHTKYKAAFEWDFIKSKPSLTLLVERFRIWRDKLELLLDSRPQKQRLEHFSHYLVEFEYQKFDDIEVPGQYYLLKDNNRDFVKIDRFHPTVELVRSQGGCSRRLTMRGHNGNLYPFSVQHPAHRQCRREEKLVQLMRILNRKKESRKRNLSFHLPIIVPLAPQARLVQDDTSYVSLYEIYEDFCVQSKMHKDEPIVFFLKRMKEIMLSEDISKRTKVDLLNLKTEIMEEISNQMIPDFILSKYMARTLKSSSDLWLIRKQFTQQMAAITFMTYILCVGQRYPGKFIISRNTGNVWASEFAPAFSNSSMLFSNQEAVPFRFTPNIQQFMSPVGIEGVFTSSLMSVARSLTEPEFNLEGYLSIFVKDELIAWQTAGKKPPFQESQLRELVGANVDVVVRKAQALACHAETEKHEKDVNIPVNQSILDLISQAVNPLKLAQMDLAFMPSL